MIRNFTISVTVVRRSRTFHYRQFSKVEENNGSHCQNKKDIPESSQIIYSELAVLEFPQLKEYLTN